MDDLKQAVQREMSFAATVQAVLWSFFGVRKNQDYEADAAKLNPLHVVIAGVIAAILFVISLLVLVNLVVAGSI